MEIIQEHSCNNINTISHFYGSELCYGVCVFVSFFLFLEKKTTSSFNDHVASPNVEIISRAMGRVTSTLDLVGCKLQVLLYYGHLRHEHCSWVPLGEASLFVDFEHGRSMSFQHSFCFVNYPKVGVHKLATLNPHW